MKTAISKIFLIVALLQGLLLSAQLRLPSLVSDGMVLQRDQVLNIWGYGNPKQVVNVTFLGKKFTTKVGADGQWNVKIPAQKYGGPYEMKINEITIKNILIGDVWLASGQSNMEMPMYRLRTLYKEVVETAKNSNIRFFTVPQKYNFKSPQKDIEGGVWEETSPAAIKQFSGVAYFFAKKLEEDIKVPIGIIHASLGGSPIQSWMDASTLKKYPEDLLEAERWKSDELIESTEKTESLKSKNWYELLDATDLGLKENWQNFDLVDSAWKVMSVPGSWQDTEGSFSGTVWFRKEIFLPKGVENKTAFLNLGRIKDADQTYVNGTKVGNVTYEYPPRWYDVPKGILREGKNVIAVRITNGTGRGEFIADKPYFIEIDGNKMDLKGPWKFKVGTRMEQSAPGQTFIRWKPTGLYNQMIHPLTPYKVKGFLWYQGESNTAKPQQYTDLLTTMIKDWRAKFEVKEAPFLIVQLANFMEKTYEPIESHWAELREAQREVSLQVPNTGLAVTTDVGEWNDIHPLDKKTVGERLALLAEKIAYKKNIVAEGPSYERFSIEGNQIVLHFIKGTNQLAKVEELKGFAIKGEDGKWVWAQAKIEGDKVLVSADAIDHPQAVRYNWANNPQGNLFNVQGLPASPFTTE